MSNVVRVPFGLEEAILVEFNNGRSTEEIARSLDCEPMVIRLLLKRHAKKIKHRLRRVP